MGPLTYSLCHKPVLGLAMFVAGACGFPPLFHEEPFPLQQASAGFVKEFEAPVSKPYSLLLVFGFPSANSIRSDEVAGTGDNSNCERDYEDIPEPQRAAVGRPIPVRVSIREKRTGAVEFDSVFNSLCTTSTAATGNERTRTVARFPLTAGKYIIEIRNMASQAGLDDVKTTVSLVSAGRNDWRQRAARRQTTRRKKTRRASAQRVFSL
ncbi:MAG: hypothetical protein JWP72_3727 [Massilia sp.]|nr:hypothetical protein [Massilia sp.]